MSEPLHTQSRPPPWRETIVHAVAFAGAYVFAADLGHALSFKPGNFATFWPPSGLFLAVLLLTSPRRWPVFIAAALLANIFSDVAVKGHAFTVSLGFSTGNALEAVVGAALIRYVTANTFTLDSVRHLFALTVIGAGGSTLLSAAVGAGTVSLAFGNDYWTSFRLWWIGDVMGVLTFAPLILTVARVVDDPALDRADARRGIEAVLMLTLCAAGAWVTASPAAFAYGMTYLVFPALLWAALRFGTPGAVLGSVVVAVTAVLAATRVVYEPAAGVSSLPVEVQAMQLQSFLAIAIITALVVGALTDDRRHASADHARQSDLMQALFDQASDSIFAKSADGRYLAANRRAAANVGLSVEEMLKRSDADLVPPEQLDALRAVERAVLDRGVTIENDLIREVGGERKVFAAVKSPLRDASGRIIGLTAVSRDVTEQRAALGARRHDESRLRDFARTSGDWFWESDENHRFTWLSDDVEKILGVKPEWHYGKTRQELAGGKVEFSREPWKSHLEALCRHEPIRNFVYKRLGPDGERWLSVNAVPVFDPDGTFRGYRGTGSDVTARVEDEERAALADDMRRGKELAERASHAKTEFLSRISHELRTPLNAILGFAQTMELDERAQLADPHRQAVQHIQQAGAHLLVLINEVLELSNIEAGRVELSIGDIAITPLVNECITLVSPLAMQTQVHIADAVATDAGGVRADPLRLKQVLLNLISNAVKYSREGGTVRVTSRPANTTGFTEILVEDQGVGLTEVQMQRLMIALHNPDRPLSRSEGTGIGLTITKRFVDMMGGVLLFSSRVGEGTTVTLRLPSARVSVPNPVARKRRFDDIADAHYGPRRVVYIEDNPINARVVLRMLQARPQIDLAIAVDGESGLRMVREQRPHLVLIDLDLPDISGFDVLQHIRSDPDLAATPCVAVTASIMPDTVARGRALGFIDFIGKPVEMRGFIARVDVLLEAAEPQLH